MSRCRACDKKLNEFELTRKIVRPDDSIEYVDMCNKCFRESGLDKIVPIVERYDLQQEEDTEEDLQIEDD